MNSEAWIAIYAAVVATTALFLNFRSWYEQGVRLNLNLTSDARVVGDNRQGMLAITVINRGGQVTTLTHCVILRFDNPLKRWCARASSSFAITNTEMGGTGALPFELDIGRKWTGVARKRFDVIPSVEDGKHYMGVYASNRVRPYLVRIPKSHSKLPKGIKRCQFIGTFLFWFRESRVE